MGKETEQISGLELELELALEIGLENGSLVLSSLEQRMDGARRARLEERMVDQNFMG